MKLCCVFSLESPHRSDSNEYTQYTIFNIYKRKSPFIIPNLQVWDFSKGPKNEFKTAVENHGSCHLSSTVMKREDSDRTAWICNCH